ncbi:hypothetical protein MAP00_007920 [Monascus purpureus]|nr:hypothetical protein MAP00_007920 [Monascus purpureus]
MPCEEKCISFPVRSPSINFSPPSARPSHLLATAASPGGSYSEAIEKQNIGPNSRPVPQIPSELATCIREAPAGNTHQMAIERLLNPSPPPAAPIFQNLLPISKLLIPAKKSSPNTTYRCTECHRIYRKRASFQYHIGKDHLHIYPVKSNSQPKPLPPLTCICGRLVCSWKEYLLCFSNHCCGEWRARTDSDHLLLHALEETIGSFRTRINQEFPSLTHDLVDRLARAQLRQFGCVIENIRKHAQRAVHHGCNEYCFSKSLPHEVADASRGSFTSTFFLSLDKLSGIFECPCCLQVKVNTLYHI